MQLAVWMFRHTAAEQLDPAAPILLQRLLGLLEQGADWVDPNRLVFCNSTATLAMCMALPWRQSGICCTYVHIYMCIVTPRLQRFKKRWKHSRKSIKVFYGVLLPARPKVKLWSHCAGVDC